MRISPQTAPGTPSIEVVSGCRTAHHRAPKRHGAPQLPSAGFRRPAWCEGDHGATGWGSPSSSASRGRRTPTSENAADSARRRFFARLHCCAIHAERHQSISIDWAREFVRDCATALYDGLADSCPRACLRLFYLSSPLAPFRDISLPTIWGRLPAVTARRARSRAPGRRSRRGSRT